MNIQIGIIIHIKINATKIITIIVPLEVRHHPRAGLEIEVSYVNTHDNNNNNNNNSNNTTNTSKPTSKNNSVDDHSCAGG